MALLSDTQQLIERLLNGDEEAYNIIRQWVSTVVGAGQLGRLLQPYRDDIVQEVMLEALSNLKANKFSGRSTLKVYVQRIAQNICINWWRHHFCQPETPIPLDSLNREPIYTGKDPYQSVEAADQEKKWGDAFRQLSKDCQQLLQMVWEEKKHYREIAATLNTTETVIKQRVHRCTQRLAEFIKG